MVEKHPIEAYFQTIIKSFKKSGIVEGFDIGIQIEGSDDDLEIQLGGKTTFTTKDNWLIMREIRGSQEIEVNHFIDINKIIHIQEL